MNKQTNTSEGGLEAYIAGHLVAKEGFVARPHTAYNRGDCLDRELLFAFLEKSQPKAVAKLKKHHGELYEQKIVKRLQDQLAGKGLVEVLRKGITDGFTDTKLHLFYDQPVSAYNGEAAALYACNTFSVMQQLHYSGAAQNSLDLGLFLNGIPICTLELKNELTGQNVHHAIRQYQHDRDPAEPLFALGRLLVHFAVDTEEVWMCTHLQGENSRFLPFNKGFNNGAGNPPNGAGIKTSYLWEEILTKESLTNIIQNFCQLLTEEVETTDAQGRTKTRKTKKMLFPRYHQLVAVRQMLADAQKRGAGGKYLIQHSAGSGKSNSIAWLAHQLVGLHNPAGEHVIFDTVIVVTDRRVLDAQIRANIKGFQQVAGVVEAITEGSRQLKEALEEGKKIIITTIQKFPFIVDEIGELPGARFAIIIDEAHSSLSGQMARKLNEVLAKSQDADGPAEDEDGDTITGEDLIMDLIKSRKLLPNASYFAFTATPKNKTLELFGVPLPAGGKTAFRAFHLYSMKQAIEEGFIMDVLQNYTTYQSYYALLKKIEDDPEYDKKRAQKRLRAYVESHEHAVKKKTMLIVDHFGENLVRTRRMGGQAKAMVVTSSRANAVAFKFAFDNYLKAIHSPCKAIVAFSGEVDGHTETSLNGFPSAVIPAEFQKSDARFLIVADKFQTGFDQPLLHTMYVDKKLGGVNAVQTLSRLNRSHPLKKETFVLDFANSAEDIAKAFEPYFESTVLGEATDPNKLFDLQDALDGFGVYDRDTIQTFSDKILAGAPINELHALLDTSAALFRGELSEEAQSDFRAKAKTYVRLYIFLSQIVPFESPYLERLYMFLSHLQNKLGGEAPIDLAKEILDHIDMDSYRLQLEATTNIMMEPGEPLQPIPTDMRGGGAEAERDRLSAILQTFNDRYGTQFEDVDKVRQMAESVARDVAQNKELRNSMEFSDSQNARITSDKIVGEELLKHITTNFDLYKSYSDNPAFREDFSAMLFGMVKGLVKGNFGQAG